MSETLSERIAAVVLDCFEGLPRKCRPRPLPDGRNEWTPLSAIVACRGGDLTCISLATGTKCLPRSRLPLCHGAVVHDSHAEVLALRGLNRWLLDEALLVARGSRSDYIIVAERGTELGESSSQILFQVNDKVSFHMFTTEAPCGDASMELLIASKGREGSVAWTPKPLQTSHDSDNLLLGRGYFSELGRVRRKPARRDAEQSCSKSCTDKLTMKQYLGLLSFPADLLIGQTRSSFLESIILPADQANEPGYTRAFNRGRRLTETLDLDSVYVKIVILPGSFRKFPYARSQPTTNTSKVSNVSAFWVCGHGNTAPAITEVLINGVQQGFRQFDARIAKESAVCRHQMWCTAQQVLDSFEPIRTKLPLPLSEKLTEIETALTSRTYAEAKAFHLRSHRTFVKQTVAKQLGEWPPNKGDESWGTSRERA